MILTRWYSRLYTYTSNTFTKTVHFFARNNLKIFLLSLRVKGEILCKNHMIRASGKKRLISINRLDIKLTVTNVNTGADDKYATKFFILLRKKSSDYLRNIIFNSVGDWVLVWLVSRDVAQIGSALDLGSRSRRFNPCRPETSSVLSSEVRT